MISTKMFQLFLLSLVTLPMHSIAADGDHYQRPTTMVVASSGIRGTMRLLQQDTLASDDNDASSSEQTSRDFNNETSVDNDSSIDDDLEQQSALQRSGFVAPKARQCNTRK